MERRGQTEILPINHGDIVPETDKFEDILNMQEVTNVKENQKNTLE